MNAYVNYIIEANIGLALFLVVYQVVLRRETNFRLLRIFMLTGIFASLLFPLLHLQTNEIASGLSMHQVIPAYWLPEMSIGVQTGDGSEIAANSFWIFASTLYAIGLITFAVAVLVQLSQLLFIIRRSRTYTLRRMRIAESAEDKPTFSFFNFIFIGRANALSTEEKKQMIQHETAHARQWHSFDILLISVVRIFFWFNPFITTYKKILVQLHEFEADAHAVENADMNRYCSLLAKVALESADFKLANHFNTSLTVKRIAMIRSPKNTMRYWKVAVCALLFPATFVLVSCQDQLGKSEDISAASVSEVAPAMPVGGLDAFYNEIKRHITYPAESRAGHKYGRVLVRFVVNENGSLSDIALLESPDEILGKEALRVLTLSPEWTPAKADGVPIKQQMVLPIEFKLDFPGQSTVVTPKEENANSVRDEKTSHPQIFETSLQQIFVIGYVDK